MVPEDIYGLEGWGILINGQVMNQVSVGGLISDHTAQCQYLLSLHSWLIGKILCTFFVKGSYQGRWVFQFFDIYQLNIGPFLNCMSPWFIGIWWYSLCKSIVLKILQPAAYISKIKHIQLGIRIRLCHSVAAVEINACPPDTIRFFNHMTIWRDRR